MINFLSSQWLTLCSLVGILHENCAFQRCKNAARNALVEISLIQLDIVKLQSKSKIQTRS